MKNESKKRLICLAIGYPIGYFLSKGTSPGVYFFPINLFSIVLGGVIGTSLYYAIQKGGLNKVWIKVVISSFAWMFFFVITYAMMLSIQKKTGVDLTAYIGYSIP